MTSLGPFLSSLSLSSYIGKEILALPLGSHIRYTRRWECVLLLLSSFFNVRHLLCRIGNERLAFRRAARTPPADCGPFQLIKPLPRVTNPFTIALSKETPTFSVGFIPPRFRNVPIRCLISRSPFLCAFQIRLISRRRVYQPAFRRSF